jgi:hypothetical protein
MRLQKFIQENISLEKNMDMEPLDIKVEISIKENLKQIYLMELVNIFGMMV